MVELLYTVDQARAEAKDPNLPFAYLRDLGAQALKPLSLDDFEVFVLKEATGEMLDNGVEHNPIGEDGMLFDVLVGDEGATVLVVNEKSDSKQNDAKGEEPQPQKPISPEELAIMSKEDANNKGIEDRLSENGRGRFLINTLCQNIGFTYEEKDLGDLHEARLFIPLKRPNNQHPGASKAA